MKKVSIDSIVLLTDKSTIVVVYTDGHSFRLNSDKDVLSLMNEMLCPITSNCTTLTQLSSSLEDTAVIAFDQIA